MSLDLTCPRKHPVGRKGAGGECTPVRCGDAEAERLRQQVSRAARKAKAEALKAEEAQTVEAVVRAKDEEEKAAAQETRAIQTAARRHNKWMAFLTANEGIPKFDSLEAAERWFDNFAIGLLPVVALKLKQKLFYGNEREQDEAMTKILATTGRSKKEAAAVTAPPIVIQVNGGVSLPWRQDGAAKVVETVDAVVVEKSGTTPGAAE